MSNPSKSPTRAEYLRLAREVRKLAERMNDTTRELNIQFQRMAELQAEVDLIRAASTKMRPRLKRREIDTT